MKKRNINKKMRFLARIISLLLVVILVSEEFLGSGNIVLAAPQEENSVVEDISAENDAEDPETSEEEVQVLFELEAFREQNSKQLLVLMPYMFPLEYRRNLLTVLKKIFKTGRLLKNTEIKVCIL